MRRSSIGPVTGQSCQREPAASQRANAQRNPHLRRLRLESLEDRRLLSVGALPMPPAQVESLLVNGGFETGDFTG